MNEREIRSASTVKTPLIGLLCSGTKIDKPKKVFSSREETQIPNSTHSWAGGCFQANITSQLLKCAKTATR